MINPMSDHCMHTEGADWLSSSDLHPSMMKPPSVSSSQYGRPQGEIAIQLSPPFSSQGALEIEDGGSDCEWMTPIA